MASDKTATLKKINLRKYYGAKQLQHRNHRTTQISLAHYSGEAGNCASCQGLFQARCCSPSARAITRPILQSSLALHGSQYGQAINLLAMYRSYADCTQRADISDSRNRILCERGSVRKHLQDTIVRHFKNFGETLTRDISENSSGHLCGTLTLVGHS